MNFLQNIKQFSFTGINIYFRYCLNITIIKWSFDYVIMKFIISNYIRIQID